MIISGNERFATTTNDQNTLGEGAHHTGCATASPYLGPGQHISQSYAIHGSLAIVANHKLHNDPPNKPPGTQMNIASLYEGIGNELQASKDRVRNLIGDAHWLSDGIWKEKVLISALRRHLPHNVRIGTGFIAGKDGLTKQIDIILYDANRPQLFKDDDFVILTPESVIGIIEVKTKFNTTKYKEELKTIRDNIHLIRSDGKRTPQEGESKYLRDCSIMMATIFPPIVPPNWNYGARMTCRSLIWFVPGLSL